MSFSPLLCGKRDVHLVVGAVLLYLVTLSALYISPLSSSLLLTQLTTQSTLIQILSLLVLCSVEIVCITTEYFPGLGSASYVIHLTIRIDTLASLARSSSSLFHHDHLCLELFLQAFAQPFNPRERALQYLFAGARTRIEMLCPALASSLSLFSSHLTAGRVLLPWSHTSTL